MNEINDKLEGDMAKEDSDDDEKAEMMEQKNQKLIFARSNLQKKPKSSFCNRSLPIYQHSTINVYARNSRYPRVHLHHINVNQDEHTNRKPLTKIDGVEVIKYDSKAYKMNATDCSTRITISEGGLILKYSDIWYPISLVRATMPIPAYNLELEVREPSIAFYYEMEILEITAYVGWPSIIIGFCEQEFPLEGKWLGYEKNSIGICHKTAISIDARTRLRYISGYFTETDVVGIGITHQPNLKMQCFATLNGHFLTRKEMPVKFVNMQLFPAINLLHGNSVRIIFVKNKWRFKEFGRVFE